MRKGFTMIELIFVIVILGILAAVAVPKLAATRDDAQVSKMAANLSTLVSDAAAYYTSQGSSKWGSAKIGEITNVALNDSASSASFIDSNTSITTTAGFFMNADASNNCFKITATSDGNLTIVNGTQTTGVCKSVQDVTKGLVKTHSFGGTGVQR